MNGVRESTECETGCGGVLYRILMHSRAYGTSGVDCPALSEAAHTLAWLAERAEHERRMDGVQRYFCLLSCQDQDAESSVDTLLADALILRLTPTGLSSIVAEGLDERPILVLEQPEIGTECPLLCWESTPQPLSTLQPHEQQAASAYLMLRDLRGGSQPSTSEADLSPDPVLLAWQARETDTSCNHSGAVPFSDACSEIMPDAWEEAGE